MIAAATLGILILGAAACGALDTQSPVEKTLRDFLAGKVDPAVLEIRYSDLHALHGGEELTVRGTGVVDLKVVRQPYHTPRHLTPAQVRELVALLIELAAWQQRTPERQPVPDESRARLFLRVGDHRSEIWEWYNDLGPNRRIGRLRDTMRRLSGLP